MISLTLPDGSIREMAEGSCGWDLAEAISPRLKKAAFALKYNGKLVDIYEPLKEDGSVEIVTDRHKDALDIYRHTSAHLLAQAVKQLHPGAKIAGGPVVHDGVNGFYYDFEIETALTQDDLGTIEKHMKKLAKENIAIRRQDISKSEALKEFSDSEEPYKAYFCSEKGDETVSVYRQGDFTDFCLGPHLPSTSMVKNYKLLSVSGAYWLGDEKNQMMQRIYGISFFKKQDLEDHLTMLEEVKKRDHRKLGKDLDLFFFDPISPASPFFLPNGAFIYNSLVDFIKGLYTKYGYQEVITPQIFDVELWKTSGHWKHFKDNMFICEADNRTMGVKPMNCPAHAMMFRSKKHSYRDLPIRYADFGRLHRYERSGATSGLTRVRSFAQDDAHIFCTTEQIAEEIDQVFAMMEEVYKTFGFEKIKIYLSTRPEKYMGEIDVWNKAEQELEQILKNRGLDYEINPGDGAFYGPKIDFNVQDALTRNWQLATIQLDFAQPESFGLGYVAQDNSSKRPVMIHRAILGSLERFMGILIEHMAGAFPLWLSPLQAAILPISDKVLDYCREIEGKLSQAGMRAWVDDRGERIGYKIREAQLKKHPIMLVVGDQEVENGTVSLRLRGEGDQGSQKLDELLEKWGKMVYNRELGP